MSRDYHLYLKDILEACKKLMYYSAGITFEQFSKDDMRYDAILHNLEIIGEAAKHVPEEIKSKYPKVEWRRISGLRDIVAHVYFGVSDEIIWDVTKNNIPSLYEQIKDLLRSEELKSS